MADALAVLFVCTGNSARSVMAEALLDRHGRGRLRGYSAGAHPAGVIHPLTLRTLFLAGLPTAGLTSKSWDVFLAPGAPELDFVFTLCDHAYGEPCPAWPGRPIAAYWGFPDPAAATGNDAERLAAFAEVFRQIERRIELFCALPLEALDRLAAHRALEDLGRV